MCKWGTTKDVIVSIPARLSHTGHERTGPAPIDACIAPLVEALNAAGVVTDASCCGHGRGAGSIILRDGRELTIWDDSSEAEAAWRHVSLERLRRMDGES